MTEGRHGDIYSMNERKGAGKIAESCVQEEEVVEEMVVDAVKWSWA